MYHDTEILGEGYNERYGFDEYDPYDPFGDYEENDFERYMYDSSDDCVGCEHWKRGFGCLKTDGCVWNEETEIYNRNL